MGGAPYGTRLRRRLLRADVMDCSI